MAAHPANVNALRRAVSDLGRLGTVTTKQDMAIVSLVGKQMKHTCGVAARMFCALADAGTGTWQQHPSPTCARGVGVVANAVPIHRRCDERGGRLSQESTLR